MAYKGVYVFVSIAVVMICVQSAVGRPRDSSVQSTEGVERIDDGSLAHLPEDQKVNEQSHTDTEFKIPGRVSCQYEEATEDIACQEHCLPKGYSYGLCVSNTCSCI